MLLQWRLLPRAHTFDELLDALFLLALALPQTLELDPASVDVRRCRMFVTLARFASVLAIVSGAIAVRVVFSYICIVVRFVIVVVVLTKRSLVTVLIPIERVFIVVCVSLVFALDRRVLRERLALFAPLFDLLRSYASVCECRQTSAGARVSEVDGIRSPRACTASHSCRHQHSTLERTVESIRSSFVNAMSSCESACAAIAMLHAASRSLLLCLCVDSAFWLSIHT